MNMRYDLEALSTGQTDMNKGATSIDDILEGLAAQVGPLIERFVGNASGAYYTAQAQWDRKAAELNAIFVQGSNQVGTSAENMGGTDNAGANRFYAV
ncbi:MAG: WXG100 family type VII secretion target [Flaviflexus sp.]|uniref:WXG100 family type VII secretion target n=1 Tax=Flaviflexus sp. TaxID=1969482 RepID=UPI00352CF5ED